jgi:hypothetical protein
MVIRFLQSEPKAALKSTLGPLNSKLQISSIALIQAIVARGDLNNTSLDAIETTVITKLYSCIHSGRLDLQTKLLHLLHSVILAASTTTDIPHQSRRSRLHPHRRSAELSTHMSVSADNLHAPESQRKLAGTVNPLLAQTLIIGISAQTNRPIFQHWIDFILMTIPQFQQSLQHLVFPICECICQQLRVAVADLERIRQREWKGNVESTITDGEFIMFLHALERLVLQGLSKADAVAPESLDDLPGASEKVSDRATEGTGLLGYVTNVFATDGSTASVDGSLSVCPCITPTSMANPYLQARSPGYRCLHDAVRILYTVWLSTGTTTPSDLGPEADTILLIQGRTRLRCRKVMERLFRAQSAEVLESLIECWFDDAPVSHRPYPQVQR